MTYLFEKKNQIIFPTVHKSAKSLMGLEKADKLHFLSLRFGDGGNDESGLVIEPTGEETALKHQTRSFSHKGIPGNLFDDATGYELISPIKCNNDDKVSFKFEFAFDSKDGNAENGGLIKYSEVGLFFESGDMFAYRTFPEINKDDNTSLIIKWSFQFYANKATGGQGGTDPNKPVVIVSPTELKMKPNSAEVVKINTPKDTDFNVVNKRPTVAKLVKETKTVHTYGVVTEGTDDENAVIEVIPLKDGVRGDPVTIKVVVSNKGAGEGPPTAPKPTVTVEPLAVSIPKSSSKTINVTFTDGAELQVENSAPDKLEYQKESKTIITKDTVTEDETPVTLTFKASKNGQESDPVVCEVTITEPLPS